ncbi:hypothetical protein E1B28_011062 [Marasmius oreades]|uniref:PHD-type domain-containing protein n=1 Tax=Marasmius oreades TaxID=181124 RepID=A0A9P7UP51_9AGAR|nr:uncharacterized protein E1B28_011062 [Marasmius oreades]KAG7089372.1 hypothetical protein E1B28_011062 [Marasmius oreades]
MSSNLPLNMHGRTQLPQIHPIPQHNRPHCPQPLSQGYSSFHRQLPRPHPVPTHPQVNPVQTVSELPPCSQPISAEHLSSYIVNAITQVLSQHQHQTKERMQTIETSFQSQLAPISKSIEDFRKKVEANNNDLAQLLKKSNDVHQRAIQTVANRIMDLERLVGGCGEGKQAGYGDSKTILERLDAISFAVEDLLERAQDPQANKEPTLLHDSSTDQIPQGILRRDLATSPIPELVQEVEKSRSSVCYHERGTSPINTGQTLCSLSPVDWNLGKRYPDPILLPPSPVSDELCRVIGSPTPALVDGHDGGLDDENHNDSRKQGVEDCHSRPSAPESPGYIDTEDTLFDFEPTAISTPARTHSPQSVPQAISPAHDDDFVISSSRSPSLYPSLHDPTQSVTPVLQPTLDVRSPEAVVDIDDFDEQSVEQMVTASTPSMTNIATTREVKIELQKEDSEDIEMSDLSSLSSLETSVGDDYSEDRELSEQLPPKKRRTLAKESSFTKKGRTSATSSPSKRSSRNMKSLGNNQKSLSRKRRSDVGKPRKKRIKWPQKIVDDSEGSHNRFIQCDKCHMWFHWGCVGLESDDPILLDEKQEFACPACLTGRWVHSVGFLGNSN